jgi:hypothetical protein
MRRERTQLDAHGNPIEVDVAVPPAWQLQVTSVANYDCWN